MKKKTKRIIIYSIIAALILLVAFLIISRTCIDCWGLGKKNIETVDINLEDKLKQMLADKNTKLVMGIEESKIIEAERGTENFGVPIAFSPTNRDAWGLDNTRCKYSISIVKQAGYCINSGWSSIEQDIVGGVSISTFEHVNNYDNVGYAMIKINIPKEIPVCTQRFKISVECTGFNEATSGYFDLKVI